MHLKKHTTEHTSFGELFYCLKRTEQNLIQNMTAFCFPKLEKSNMFKALSSLLDCPAFKLGFLSKFGF